MLFLFFTSINTTLIMKENKLSLHLPYSSTHIYQIIKTGKNCNLRKIIPLETLTVRISQNDYHTRGGYIEGSGFTPWSNYWFQFSATPRKAILHVCRGVCTVNFSPFLHTQYLNRVYASISSLIVDSSPLCDGTVYFLYSNTALF